MLNSMSFPFNCNISHIKETIEEAIASVSTEILENVCKIINSRINHTIKITGENIEQHDM